MTADLTRLDTAMAIHRPLSGDPAILRDLLNSLESASVKTLGGAKGDGSTDDTLAFTVAIAALLASGKNELELLIPPGIYKLTGQIAITLPANKVMVIRGEGQNVSEMRWTISGGGLSVSYAGDGWFFRASGNPGNSFELRNLSLTTTATSGGGTALLVDGSSVTGRPAMETILRGVTARGATAAGQWDVCFDLLDAADTRVEGCYTSFAIGSSSGIGVRYRASGAGVDPTAHMISDYRQYYGSIGIAGGNYIEGIHASSLMIVAVDYGVSWATSTGESLLNVRGSHISARTACLYLKNVQENQIFGNLLYKNDRGDGTAWTGVLLDACGASSISGNTIKGSNSNSENGIVVDNTVSGASWFDDKPSVIGGNIISAINGSAIWLKANTAQVHAADNHFSQVLRRVLNDGAKTGAYRNTNRSRFEGALVTKKGGNQSVSDNTEQVITFDTEEYDTGDLDSGSGGIAIGNAMRVPYGCSRVRLKGQVAIAGASTLRYVRACFRKGGTRDFVGNGQNAIATDATSQNTGGYIIAVESGVIDASPGDTFDFTIYALNDGNSYTVLGPSTGAGTWFEMECIE